MTLLMAAIAARHVERDVWTGPMIRYVWNRVTRINQRFQALAALIAAGKLPRARCDRPPPPDDPAADAPAPSGAASDPGAAAHGHARDDQESGVPPVAPTRPGAPERPDFWRRLRQQKFAWLCALMPPKCFLPGAGVASTHLRMLMDDPEMRALVDATPRMRELLRPLFWMLGLEASLLGEGRPRRRRKPRPRPARPERPARPPSKAAIARAIAERPWPKNGRGGPPLLPGERPGGGFSPRRAADRPPKNWDFAKSV